MSKNIIIFSDGTGQGGGVSVDERRTNIYKLYRATRVGHDSPIVPSEQVAYYDAGLGSRPPGGGAFRTLIRTIHNFVSQATGLGLTANIIDCYGMIIRHWQPGDRIFLFGFSRGAYTVRCLGGVLALCGVPVRLPDGRPMKYDCRTVRRIATEAVKSVYQHTASRNRSKASRRQLELLDQRSALASQFREKYGVDHDRDTSHYPYFIGVFDTVASIASMGALVLLSVAVIAFGAALAYGLGTLSVPFLPFLDAAVRSIADPLLAAFGLSVDPRLHWYIFVAVLFFGVTAAWSLRQSLKFAPSANRAKWWRTLTLSIGRLRFDDMSLSENVKYARHAIAIDEDRASFGWVPWVGARAESVEKDEHGIAMVEQRWFAGNHSDVGGGYPESESRLSDIALAWMVKESKSVEGGLKVDESALYYFPAADGIQHDERRAGFPILTTILGISWKRKVRKLPTAQATLDPSVYARTGLAAVLQYDALREYRPETLSRHVDLRHLYQKVDTVPSNGSRVAAAFARVRSFVRRARPGAIAAASTNMTAHRAA